MSNGLAHLAPMRQTTGKIDSVSGLDRVDHETRRTREKRNSGDQWAGEVKAASRDERKGLRPCGLPSAKWPVCHMRCYLRDRCWAAIAASMYINEEVGL